MGAAEAGKSPYAIDIIGKTPEDTGGMNMGVEMFG